MRPPTTVAGPQDKGALGNAKAHFSLSRGTWSAVKPARPAVWNRALVRSAPQPFQSVAEGAKGVLLAGHGATAGGCADFSWPNGLLARNSATARFCSGLNKLPWSLIRPDSRESTIFSGDIMRRAAKGCALVFSELSWQRAHCCL